MSMNNIVMASKLDYHDVPNANALGYPCPPNPYVPLTISFDLPSIPNIVPTTLSHMFFSMCITSKICLNFNSDQYPSSKNMLFLVQFNSHESRFLFLSTLLGCFSSLPALTLSNCCSISTPKKFLGPDLCYDFPSCCVLLLLA